MRTYALLAATALASLITAPALAQTATAPAPQNAPQGASAQQQLEDIVVTAERREETTQRTPIAITAFSGDTLQQRGVSSSTDLNNMVPGLAVGNNGGSVQIAIRGIGSTNDTEVGDPAVAFNVDGVYMARSRAAIGALYDVDRIEVLRGPQGTLYGRNATAGSINVITKRPSDKFEGNASLDYGNYNSLQTSGMLNVPLTDTLAVRAAFQTSRHDGYTNNGRSSNFNDEDTQAGRLQIQLKPSETFKALLSLDVFHEGGVGYANGPIGQYAKFGSPYTFPMSADGSLNHTNKGVGLTTDWDLGFATLTYVGSYREDTDRTHGGSTQSGTCQAPSGPYCASTIFRSDENQTSHELRLANSDGPLKWVAGLYYFKENNDVLFALDPVAGITSLAFVQPKVSEESKAAFAQATYSLTDSLRVTGGLRYTEDAKARTGATEAFGHIVGNTYVGGSALYLNNADLSWNSTNWKAGAEYDLAPDSMLYASVGTGYKAGGYGDGQPPNNNPYQPEKLTAYEVGLKNQFMDKRLQLNLTGFYYDYRDFQVSAIGQVAGQASTVTVNAGTAEVYGVEVEGAALLTGSDRVDGSVSYIHARYTDFILATGDVFHPNSAAVYTGNRLAKSPEWTINLGYQHMWDLASGAMITARVDSVYVGDQNLDYRNFAVTEQKAYTKTNLSLAYDDADRRWRVMAYVRNLENNAVLVVANPDTNGSGNRLAGSGAYAPPRTFGVRVSANF
ncbi:TonB-dependent receptor [Nitrospirillum pindoramense]|uniref:Iron complex outermembrane receptor protein n=1 Tax=Nitrospirillum amazonense TaxID=28077 RepID=A0A560HEG1_9PROT|nr:TonB-dependent receptor [Nitrospirillum amazonense]TWB43884.1 iron complex outermembrane receptor protein [Nitrospirillum amazonense]